MDLDNVKTVIEGLKSSTSCRVQEALLKIRSKVIVDDNGLHLFKEYDGLQCLVPHLRKPNERILDLTLSILGNICLHDQTCLAAGKLNIYSPIVTVLKTVSRDSIVGRACRVIGNLAQKTPNAEELHNHGVVPALVALIENRDKNTSYPTLTMAVRAIRQLWMVVDKREEMLSLNTVQCIALLLINECENTGMIKCTEPKALRKSQEELISGILKCIGSFTTQATSTTLCAKQLQGDGRGYQCLVALTKTFESQALKCLFNLCYLAVCRPLLGTAGMVECLVEILQKCSSVLLWPEGASCALAQLSGESVNRCRLRHCGGLPLLLAAAREDMHAMRALLQYVFDDASFQILVNEGLMSLLTDELNKHLITMKFEHSYIEPEIEEPRPTPSEYCTKNASCKDPSSKSNEDELKVVIERDNMLVGFLDAIDSATDNSADEEETPRRRGLKRTKSTSPNIAKRHRAKNDSAFGVFWELTSPEWPSTSQSRNMMSPRNGPLSPFSTYSDGNRSGISPESETLNMNGTWGWSPESGFGSSAASPYLTEYQWSPSSSTSPHSPFSTNEDSSDSEISGRYSPVCSENDLDEVPPAAVTTEEMDAAQIDFDVLTIDADMADNDDDEPYEELKEQALSIDKTSSPIAYVLVLMFRLLFAQGVRDPVPTHMVELLSGSECLKALLDYVERCKKPMGRPARILNRLFSNAICLMNILKHKFALRLHRMSIMSKHPISKCQQCKEIKKLSVKLLTRLTILAESSYGIGEISYQLLRGSDSMKETLCITLPHIVKAEKLMKKFYVDCSILPLLFSSIAKDTENDFNNYLTALVKLASNIRVKDPKALEKRFSDYISIVSYDPVLDNLSKEDIVTFELDDLSTVQANKVFLCENSDVFCAMLMGCFKESIEERVRIQNVTKSGLELLFTLLHLGLNGSKSDIKVMPMAEKLETNLEVLLLADKFLLEKLKESFCSAIMQFKLTPQTIDKIYIWSLNEGMGFLCVETVAYVLAGRMSEADRARMFRTVLNLKYREQWLDDVKSIIVRQLEPR